jgi:hypothetical protein
MKSLDWNLVRSFLAVIDTGSLWRPHGNSA